MRSVSRAPERALPSVLPPTEAPEVHTGLTLPPTDAGRESERAKAVQELVSKIADPKSPLRLSSLRAIRDLKGIEALTDRLSAELRGTDHALRERAALAMRLTLTLPDLNASRDLKTATKISAAHALTAFLSDPASKLHSGIKYTAGTDAVSALKTILPSLPEREGTRIIQALSVTAINKALSDNHRLRAVEALSGLRDCRSPLLIRQAAPALLTAMLTDHSGVVRYSAASAIAVLPPKLVDAKTRSLLVNGLISALGRSTGEHQETTRKFAAVAIGCLGVEPADGKRAIEALRKLIPIHAGSTEAERSLSNTALAGVLHLAKHEPGRRFAAAAIPDLIEALRLREPGPGNPRMLGHYFYAAKALTELSSYVGSRRKEIVREMVTAMTEVADKKYRDGNHVSYPSAVFLAKAGADARPGVSILTRFVESRICRVESLTALGAVYSHLNSRSEKSAVLKCAINGLGEKPDIVRTTAFGSLKAIFAAASPKDPAIQDAVRSLQNIAADKTDQRSSAASLLLRGFEARKR